MRRLLLLLAAALVSIAAAQYNPAALTRSLLLLPARQAWLLLRDVPDAYRFCAGQDADGTLRGCVTAKELREKATAETRSRDRQ